MRMFFSSKVFTSRDQYMRYIDDRDLRALKFALESCGKQANVEIGALHMLASRARDGSAKGESKVLSYENDIANIRDLISRAASILDFILDIESKEEKDHD